MIQQNFKPQTLSEQARLGAVNGVSIQFPPISGRVFQCLALSASTVLAHKITP
ncbi:MAG: hypothetical protein Q9M10_01330 [Mariprofundaceae bacterium]|nr:hypothetical protein [Mariprofundaceae bacterium]